MLAGFQYLSGSFMNYKHARCTVKVHKARLSQPDVHKLPWTTLCILQG